VSLETGAVSVTRSMLRDGAEKAPKTAAGVRAVPLLPALRRLLVAWRPASPHTRPGDFVIGTADGGPIHERNVRRAFESAKAAAGLDETGGRLSLRATSFVLVGAGDGRAGADHARPGQESGPQGGPLGLG
jgi:integrase